MVNPITAGARFGRTQRRVGQTQATSLRMLCKACLQGNDFDTFPFCCNPHKDVPEMGNCPLIKEKRGPAPERLSTLQRAPTWIRRLCPNLSCAQPLCLPHQNPLKRQSIKATTHTHEQTRKDNAMKKDTLNRRQNQPAQLPINTSQTCKSNTKQQ